MLGIIAVISFILTVIGVVFGYRSLSRNDRVRFENWVIRTLQNFKAIFLVLLPKIFINPSKTYHKLSLAEKRLIISLKDSDGDEKPITELSFPLIETDRRKLLRRNKMLLNLKSYHLIKLRNRNGEKIIQVSKRLKL